MGGSPGVSCRNHDNAPFFRLVEECEIRTVVSASGRDPGKSMLAPPSGKTFTAVTSNYRLIKFGKARKILFLVDRNNLGKQTEKEFQQYVSPYNNYKFTEEYPVQRLRRNTIDPTASAIGSGWGGIRRSHRDIKNRPRGPRQVQGHCVDNLIGGFAVAILDLRKRCYGLTRHACCPRAAVQEIVPTEGIS
jgi:hypothetical protein